MDSLQSLKSLPPDSLSSLLDLSRLYIQGDFSVLSKVPFSYRVPFSSCIEYTRSKCGKHFSDYSKEVEDEAWPASLKPVVLEKLTLMDCEDERKRSQERMNEMDWRIDVALSTNSLSRVLKPEVQMKMRCAKEEIEFHMTVQQFQELRRQTANLIKDMFSMDQFAFIRNLK
jgi:hypothetical protein